MAGGVIPRGRGRPRSERARQAILAAAGELLRERGLHAMSADDIAARAGVSKATIYRWWDGKEAVALDAFLAQLEREDGPLPDTGSLRGDLIAAMGARVRSWEIDPAIGRAQACLIAETQADPALREAYLTRVMGPLRAEGRSIFLRAAGRGEVGADLEIEVALDLLYGALYHRMFVLHAPLDERFVRRAVDIVVAGLGVG
jgi:AcrR family transcriptional regulator